MIRTNLLKRKSFGPFCYLLFIITLLQLTIYSVVQVTFENNQEIINANESEEVLGCFREKLLSLSRGILESYITQYDEQLKNAKPKIYYRCSEEFGTNLLYSWRNTKIDVCSGGKDSGRITCFRRNAYEMPRMLCQITNAKMRMYKPFLQYDTHDLSIDSVKITNGSILEIKCNPTIYKWIPKDQWNQAIGEFSKDHFLKNVKFYRNRHEVTCNSFVNHTVFWLDRWDARNTYHFMEDLLTTFESLLVLQEDPENVEIVIYDGYVANNQFITAWKDLFGKGVRLIRQNPFPKNTCFNKSILSMHALRSHLTQNHNHAKPGFCKSPILQGFRDWVWEKFNIFPQDLTVSSTPETSHSQQQHLQPTIIFLSRKNTTRSIENEDEILAGIKSAYPNWNLLIFQPELLETFKEQVQTVYKANILIGVHGAGLTLSMFMKPGSHLIEIFMDDRGSGNMHYRSISKWIGLNYYLVENNYLRTVPVADIMFVLNKAILNFDKKADS